MREMAVPMGQVIGDETRDEECGRSIESDSSSMDGMRSTAQLQVVVDRVGSMSVDGN